MPTMINDYLAELSTADSRASKITLLLIIFVGFVLRFFWWHTGDAYHYLAINDEISAYEVAMRFLAGEPAAYYLGQPDFAGGKAPGPYFTLFWVAAYLLGGQSVEGALFIVVLLNSAAIFLVYRLAGRFLAHPYALLTALLFATAPWTVYYAVGLWNPTPLVIIGALLFLALWQTVTVNHARSVFFVCLVLAIIPHFHMVGLFYIPAVLLVLYAMPSKLNRGWFTAGILAGIALYLPYFIGDALNDWQNLRAILAGGAGDGFSLSVLKILSAPVTVLSNLPSRWIGPDIAEYLAFGDQYFGSYVVLVGINLITLVFALYVVFGFAIKFIRLLKNNGFSLKRAFVQQTDTVFLGIMLFVPLLFFVPTGHNYATRYTIIIFPLLFIIYSLCLNRLMALRYGHILRNAVTFMVVFNVYLLFAFFNQTHNMLMAEETFMPSFRVLNEIDSVLDKELEGIPDIKLANSTAQLSELDKTLLVALPSYLNIQYRYLKPQTEQQKVKLELSPSSAEVPASRIVYKGKGIILARPTTTANCCPD